MGDSSTNGIDEKKKSHRERHSGRKADKKKQKKNPISEELTDKQRNPKAFAFNSAVKAEKRFRHKQDIETKKQHIPLVDRTPLEPPPVVIAVVGPPKVGKSTLISNLIKLYTKSPLADVKGPVTVVIGKKRRITLIECNNDINSMIDLAKIADLVLLMCDASFGFEMEVFEFLNICQVHGMPRIMGVLTHLDMIKNNKTLKNTKKMLKHRFWTEVYPGAKLFYLSGILHGEYLRNEIKNLGRFISVMKFRPLSWRTTHSYLLGDRYEDLTNQEIIRKNPKCDRNVCLYGYIRGVPLIKESFVHIAGLGDLKIHDISYLPDPCPLPEQIKKRALIEKEKLIYAPFSGVGGIVYDKDAVYVELGGSHSHNERIEDESNNIVSNLIDTKETLDTKMKHSELQLFTGAEKIISSDFKNEEININSYTKVNQEFNKDENSDLEEELSSLRSKNYSVMEEQLKDSGRIRRKVIFLDDDEDNCVSNDSDSDDYECNDTEDTEKEIHDAPFKQSDNKLHLKIKTALEKINKKCNSERSNKKEERSNEKSDNNDCETDSNADSCELDENDEDYNSDPEDNNSFELKEEMYKLKNENYDSSSLQDENISDVELESEETSAVKWKENIARKAQEAFIERQTSVQNLMKQIYGVSDNQHHSAIKSAYSEEENALEEIGGLFKVISHKQQQEKMKKDEMNLIESTLLMPWNKSVRDWLLHENKVLLENCFVTGKWKESEDASELLKLDDEGLSDEGSEVFGDFEDLEIGKKYAADESKGEKRKRNEDDEADKEALAEKKRKLKEKFDAEYDNTEKTSYYDDLKMSAEKQAQLNKTVFENMSDDVRVQIEGYRPGMYVRIEFENVPCEFIINFDPSYPLVIGALNMSEENIGFVNVKIKKHRWYKKILKTNDPLIVSLGWRRFQTVPLFSKLEDDLKFRYLKYTPEHISCNAHFWGPITPQGTGFLAVQSCSMDPETLKQQGFRIAATGSVQELDKSTQIMKKLKLIGYPLKIYKKTAFIKGMFNSALEVAKFEGARIKTVSGIRGQIKKAASKPEGCFRATFEDKIQLSGMLYI